MFSYFFITNRKNNLNIWLTGNKLIICWWISGHFWSTGLCICRVDVSGPFRDDLQWTFDHSLPFLFLLLIFHHLYALPSCKPTKIYRLNIVLGKIEVDFFRVTGKNLKHILGPRDTNSPFLCMSVVKPQPRRTVLQSHKITMTMRTDLRLNF